jgi:hypothetical protein
MLARSAIDVGQRRTRKRDRYRGSSGAAMPELLTSFFNVIVEHFHNARRTSLLAPGTTSSR